jgi:hypothetical protein
VESPWASRGEESRSARGGISAYSGPSLLDLPLDLQYPDAVLGLGSRSAIVLAILAAILTAPALAFAVPPTRLVYVRGPGADTCGDEAVLRSAVASRVGRDPFVPAAPVSVVVDVSVADGALHGRVTVLRDGVERGSQDIADRGRADASCEDLLASIALAVSIALDAESETSSPPATPVAAPPIVPLPVPPPAPPQAVPSSPVSPWSLWGSLGGRASYGEWAAPAFGPDALVELRFRRYGLAVEGRYDFWTPVSVGAASASLQRGTATLLPCAHFGWAVACGLAAFGATRATGDRVSVSLPVQTTPYAAFGARFGVDLALLPRLHLLGTLDVAGIATPMQVQVGGVGKVDSGPVEVSVGVSALASIY